MIPIHPIATFGRYFRGYAIAISLVIAALPLATLWRTVIPVFNGARPLLTVIASGSSFLLVGVIFAQRHSIARQFFPGLRTGRVRVAHSKDLRLARLFGWYPSLLWLCALLCVALYFSFLHDAVERIAYLYAVVPGGLDQQPWYKCGHLEPGKQTTVIPDAVLRDFSSPTEYKIEIVCWVEQTGATESSRQYKYQVRLPSEGSVQAILSGAPSSSIPYEFPMALFFSWFVCMRVSGVRIDWAQGLSSRRAGTF